MAERKEHLLGYLKTIDGKRFDDAVKSLTDLIDKTKDVDDLVFYLKKRIEAGFHAGKYQIIVDDYDKIKRLGRNIDDDKDLILIENEARYRLVEEKTIENFRSASIKYDLKDLWASANQIETNLKKYSKSIKIQFVKVPQF